MTAAPRVPGLAARIRGWSLRRRVAAGSAAVAVLLALLVAAIIAALAGSVASGNDVIYRWQPAASRSQELLADLVNQETGVRGYALTGRDESLQPYRDYLAQEQRDEETLAGLARGHATVLDRLDGFRSAAQQWRVATAEPLIARVRTGGAQAQLHVDDASDRARFDLIRARAAELTQAVDTISAAARRDRHVSLNLLIAALIVAAVVVAAAGLLTWRGLQWWVLGPIDHLAAQTRTVASGRGAARISPRGPPEFFALARDVETMRASGADMVTTIETARSELARSNADLEQFAYVASHDLSEPLRKVANFCQLLERQYSSQLDDKARQYIAFAVDGAKRMQTLINDLLALSRVGRTTESFVRVDTRVALERALANLELRIAESGAGVGYVDLPTVAGDPTLLGVLFENLVANAIKYRSDEAPLIAVTATRDPASRMWTFIVSDHGIGIDPQYAERIFTIFQRLHLRDEYGGTGIGLALCRKIVEYHGGHIWLDTQAPPPGATFRFTLPEGPPGDH
jgi:signal transduction histidine kinase